MSTDATITAPDQPAFDRLCRELTNRASDVDRFGRWPAEQLSLLARFGVYEWFVPTECGGQAWNAADLLRGFLRLSACCLTTTFVLTQWVAACRRIAGAEGDSLKSDLLPDLLSGKRFTTVGISHLTTSRRHLARPVLRAEQAGDQIILDGQSPWVTGGVHADVIVTGATFDDGRQVLVAAPTDVPGVSAREPVPLVALSASDTGAVEFARVAIEPNQVLAGPVEGVLAQGGDTTTGGLPTSALAIGLAAAAVESIENEAEKRPDLRSPAAGLRQEHDRLRADLLATAAGESAHTAADLRARANSLVLRATQASLTAAKGAGYVTGHPAGRWCREALFFLVWSCPQPVLDANLCEMAGLAD